MEYRPSLDGLRALSAAAVFANHAFPGRNAGFLGVDVFFVLSGYLITRILIDDVDHHGGVRFRRFYARRARRLLPALFVALALAFALWPGDRRGFVHILPPVLFYYVNWRLTFGGSVPVLPHFWTLSVEEQFYLVWPIVVALAAWRGARRFIAVSGALALGFAVARALSSSAGPPLATLFGYSSTLGRADQLLVGGCAAALHASRDRRWAQATTRVAGALAWPSALGLLVLMTRTMGGSDPWLSMGGYAAIAILAVFPVAHCATGGPSRFTRLLSSRPLVWIGRRSYGIYLFHLPIIEALEPLGRGRPGAPYVAAVSSAVATLVLAWASYRFVESRWIVTGRPAVTTPPGPIAM